MIEDVFTCTVAANHSEVIDRLNTGANACDQTGCPGRSLCEQYSIACPVLADLILNMLGETLNEFPLHIPLTIDVRECSFLNRVVSGCFVGCIANSAVDAFDHRYRCFAPVGYFHLNQGIGQPHSSQTGTTCTKLCFTILCNEIFVGVNNVIQEAHSGLADTRKVLIVHCGIFNECGEIKCSKITNAKGWESLLAAIERA